MLFRSVFCQKCAFRLIADEEQTRVAPVAPRNLSNQSEEKEIFTIRPTLMFVKIGYGAAVISAFMLVAILVQIDIFKRNFSAAFVGIINN